MRKAVSFSGISFMDIYADHSCYYSHGTDAGYWLVVSLSHYTHNNICDSLDHPFNRKTYY